MQWTVLSVLSVLLVGLAYSQNDISEDIESIHKTIHEIPGLENFNESAIPSVEDVQNAVRKKCEKYGGIGSFEKLEVAKNNLQQCLQSHFNLTKIQEELAEHRKTGSMDEVFAKYCVKTPVVRECVKDLTDAIEPCLADEEKGTLQLLLNVTESLASFACHKDGDRIAMFVAEGGFECIESKKGQIEKCVNETLGSRIPTDVSLNNLPLLIISKEDCSDYSKLQTCVVHALEKCEDNTPANIVDALFKYVRRITPCKNFAPSLAPQAHSRFIRSYDQQSDLGTVSATFYEVVRKYQPHCLKYGGQKAADEFQEAVHNVKSCSNTTMNNFKKASEEFKGLPFTYLCNEFRMGMRNCLSTIVDKIERCSSPAEAYVPKFGLEVYDSIFNFHCKDNARALKNFLGESDNCKQKIHSSIAFCIGKTKHIKMYSEDNAVTKTELCGDLKILKNCFLDISAQTCPNNANIMEYTHGMSDALYSPCCGCRMLTNYLLLVVLIIKALYFM